MPYTNVDTFGEKGGKSFSKKVWEVEKMGQKNHSRVNWYGF
jgi:hypothetical protein